MNAQDDVILKSDGDEMHGKILKINKEDLQFIYKNETIEYTVNKSEIIKITFSSGRIEFFNKKATTSNSNLKEHHNKVAILPFGYIKDQETSNAIMTKKIQQETYTIFKKKAIILQFQDPTTTNALLAKAGVNNNNVEGYTMGEICNILNVEYVVQGLVSIEKSTMTQYSNTTTTSKNKNKRAYIDSKGNIVGDIWNNTGNNKKTSNSSSYSTATQNYSTNITMNVFSDKGDNVYTKEHASFWQTQDAYKITLAFLAKRTPIYKR
ncbi:hypothetical protein [Psychroserpens jangbogonensis]|uniref:hypothetical protein n=1 Tax=Psychroserpens jangbogonensis TaxID=1484460 RepID=UPI00053E2B9A|nr:hypothetical protein [Psychroserpens jangbogonensis]